MSHCTQLRNQKQQGTQLKSSRTKSCVFLQSKAPQTIHKLNEPNKHQKMIHNLLHKRNFSSKKMFTDQTTYTYKPQISNLPFQLYPSSRSQIQISKQMIVERLVQNMKTKHEHFKLLKLEKQEEQYKKNCTFVPKISSSSKAMILAKLKTEGAQNQQPFTRLYKQGLEKKITTEKEYLTAKQRELSDQHTFQPFINPTSKAILNNQSRNTDPIFKRVEQIMQKKRSQQKFMEDAKTKEIEGMANVKIQNKKTLQILQNNPKYQSEKGNVVKRLLDNYLKEKQVKNNNIMIEEKQKYQKQCPFQPKVNKNYLLMNASSFDPEQNFLDRQKEFQDAVKQNIEIKANQLVPSFKPQINKLSQLICKERQYESLDDKLNRLNYQPLFEKEAQIQQIEKSAYKQCRFHPQINEISKALQGPLKPHACKCHPVPEQFNFMPNINKKSRQIVNNKPLQQQNKHNKQEVVNKIKMEREYNQLIQCTFQPKIKNLNKQQLKLNQNTADFVPGVKQFIEKRNQMVKRKIQDEEYKDKIFNLEKRYKSKTCTSVKQFQLSHKNYEGKGKKELIEQAEEKFKKQHPFKPNVELIR